MASLINKLRDVISPPKWLPLNCVYETIMGSMAYGVNENESDIDVYGFCIPPKYVIFPHLEGVIKGFGYQGDEFEQWQQHHVQFNQKEYDFTIYNITKYFQLLMANNPNMIDSIFTPRECVLHTTTVSEHVRENRKLFLHKGAWHTYKGYAYAQLSKIDKGTARANPKRQAAIDEVGYDTKYAYHVVRLICQAEQILTEGDLDLRKNNEYYKNIRRGEVPLDDIKMWFNHMEKLLTTAYIESKMPNAPDEKKIKQLLIDCLEIHYGSLSELIKIERDYAGLAGELRDVLAKYNV